MAEKTGHKEPGFILTMVLGPLSTAVMEANRNGFK
jgi:hypothetical protein